MIESSFLQLLSVIAAIIAVSCAVFVAARAGKWRETDDAKDLLGRVSVNEQKISVVESRLDSMPTKADLEGLKSDVRAISREVSKVDDSVTRIEMFLLEKTK